MVRVSNKKNNYSVDLTSLEYNNYYLRLTYKSIAMLGDGYGKIFKQIYAGTLRSDWKALITFEQMIVLCTPDGVFDMPPEVLHNITGIPLDIILDGIKTLESPDQRSRSAESEGRRIVRLDDHRDWGWRIVNHRYYRDLASREEKREADRVRIASKRAAEKAIEINGVANCRDVSQVSRMSPTQTQTQTQDIPSLREGSDSKLSPCPHEQIIALYHKLLPMCPRVVKWHRTRASHLKARWVEHPDIKWWERFFAYVSKSKFLTGQAEPSKDREPFFATLEWLVRESNFAKVIEGIYHKRRAA